MTASTAPGRGRTRTQLGALAALGTVAAYGAVRAKLPPAARFTGNLIAAATANAAAALLGVGRDGLGLAPDRHRHGITWGTLAGATVASAVAGLATVGPVRPYFADERIGSQSRGRAAAEASIRIPLETAVAEELIFRGAALGLARRSMGDAGALAVTSLLFGLWHVPPALDALGASAASSAVGSKFGAVAGTVAATTVAGAVLGALRLRSGSVIAPTLVHGALNIAGFSAARRATSAVEGGAAGGR